MSVTNISGSSTTNNAVTDPNNALVADGASAIFDHNDDWLKVTGFSFAGTSISRVRLCILGRRSNVGNGQINVSYELSGTPTGSNKTIKFTSPNFSTQYIDVTNDMSWTQSDINNLTVYLDAVDISATKQAEIDHVFVEVTSTSLTTLTTPGQFKRFFINATPIKVIQTPAGNDSFMIKIQNLDENTQHLYISHSSADLLSGGGWKLLPADSYTTQCKGNIPFFVYFPNLTEEIEVSMHEV